MVSQLGMQSAQSREGCEEGFLGRCQERKSILIDGILLTLEGEEGRRLAREGEEDLVEHSISDSLSIGFCIN